MSSTQKEKIIENAITLLKSKGYKIIKEEIIIKEY